MKRKVFKKKLISTAMLSCCMFYTPFASALLPTTDVGNLMEALAGNIQQSASWAQEKSMLMYKMDLSSMLEELSVDNTNNAISNLIIRTGAAKEEVQNLDVMEKSIPDRDAADTLTTQVLEKNADCASSIKTNEKVNKSLEKNCKFDVPEKAQIKDRKKIVSKFIADCESLVDDSITNKDENKIDKSMCLKASILTGGTTYDTYTKDEEKAVNQYIKLIAGVAPALKNSHKYKDSKNAHNDVLIKEMRREAVRSLVVSSLTEIANNRAMSSENSNNPLMSKLNALTDFVHKRYQNEHWLKTLENVDHGEKNSVMPSQTIRKLAVMDSFLAHMSVLQYKQQLRMEALQSAQLAITADPLK